MMMKINYYIQKNEKCLKILFKKRLDKIEEITSKIDDNNLIFTTLTTGETFNFTGKNDPLTLLKNIRDGKTTLEKAKDLQENLNNSIKKLRKGNKTQEQRKTLVNLNMLFNGRNGAIKFYDDYSSMILKAKKMTAEQGGTRLKILTPKQMLQKLPIVLAQVKAGNNSESLLNEIRQIVYSPYQSKQFTKKVYNEIIESIQYRIKNGQYI